MVAHEEPGGTLRREVGPTELAARRLKTRLHLPLGDAVCVVCHPHVQCRRESLPRRIVVSVQEVCTLDYFLHGSKSQLIKKNKTNQNKDIYPTFLLKTDKSVNGISTE